MSSWYSLLDMVGMDHMAVGVDVDVAAGVESQKYAPMSSGSPVPHFWKLVESYRLQTLCEYRERRRGYPADVDSGKNCCLGEDVGDDEPILAGKKVLEKLQKKLNGPKKKPKHVEAKQNWINRESKRLEAETARLAELQESLRVRKETLKVAYEEIKILREDLLREGETMDKNKTHFVSPEDTEEIRRLEL